MKTEQQKLKALEINCFSLNNNGGYEDLLGLHESEETLDEADMHLFVEELADELMAYNELLSEEDKVNLDRKEAVAVAIRESRRVTYRKPTTSERTLRTVKSLKRSDPYWTRIMNDESGHFTIS